MSKKEFLEKFKAIAPFIDTNNVNNKNIDINDLEQLGIYIYNNPNDNDVIEIKNWIMDIYQQPFFNQNLLNAFSMSDELKYLKIQKIAQYLPYRMLYTNHPNYFFKLIPVDSIYFGGIPKFYETLLYLFKKENMCSIDKEYEKLLINFINKNTSIMNRYISEYKDFNTELENYRNTLTEERNKILGNIGELYIFSGISDAYNVIFTSRDLGDGFGYDMYYQTLVNGQIIENLIEVKTTTMININNKRYIKDDDEFKLTDNEYRVMLEAKENNANYYIARVLFDSVQNVPIDYCYLQLCEDNVLRSLDFDNDNIEYYIEVQKNEYDYINCTCKRKTNNKVKKI